MLSDFQKEIEAEDLAAEETKAEPNGGSNFLQEDKPDGLHELRENLLSSEDITEPSRTITTDEEAKAEDQT